MTAPKQSGVVLARGTSMGVRAMVTAQCARCEVSERIVGDVCAQRAAIDLFVSVHAKVLGCQPCLVFAAEEVVVAAGRQPDIDLSQSEVAVPRQRR